MQKGGEHSLGTTQLREAEEISGHKMLAWMQVKGWGTTFL